MKHFLYAILVVALLVTPANAFIGSIDKSGGSSGGGVSDHDSLTGVSPNDHHVPTVDTDTDIFGGLFDCTVDDSGGADYLDINTAWTGGCRKMFIKDGTYALTADMTETDPSTVVWIVGESMQGVVLDLAGYTFYLTHSGRTAFSRTNETVTVNSGSTAVAGQNTTFQTWDMQAGDLFCIDIGSHPCVEIASITDETNLVLAGGWPSYDVATTKFYYYSWYRPYHDLRLENLTLDQSGSGDVFTMYTSNDDSVLFRPTFKNINQAIGVSGFIDICDDYCMSKGWFENIHSPDDGNAIKFYSSDATVINSTMYPDNSSGPGILWLGNSFNEDISSRYSDGNEIGMRMIGNRLNGTTDIDYTGDGMIAIGNTLNNSAGGAGGNISSGPRLIEQLQDSLNLPGSLYLGGTKIATYNSALDNLSIGEGSFDPAVAGPDNIAIGFNAGNSYGATAYRNIAIGDSAGGGDATTAGALLSSDNIFIGDSAGGYWEGTGDANICIGSDTCVNGYGYPNEGIGDDNVMIGSETGGAMEYASDNVVIGTLAGVEQRGTAATLSDENVWIGYRAGDQIENGSDNVLIGGNIAGVLGGSGESPERNVIIGQLAGDSLDASSSNNVVLGPSAGPVTPAEYSNRLYIDNTETDSPLLYGEFDRGVLSSEGSIIIPEGFDCVVDDSFSATDTAVSFDTINDAWAGGCYKQFIKNGSYAFTADMTIDDPSQPVWLIGESRDGVLIDKDDYSILFQEDGRAEFTQSNETVSVTQGTEAITGTNTTFQTWGYAAGDYFCTDATADALCIPIESVDSETGITLVTDWPNPTLTDAAFEHYMIYTPYKDVRFENFTITKTTVSAETNFIETWADGAPYEDSILIGPKFKNITTHPDAESGFLARNWMFQYGDIDSVDSWSTEIYLGQSPGTTITNSIQYIGSTGAVASANIGATVPESNAMEDGNPEPGTRYIGNAINPTNDIDFSSGSTVAIGNAFIHSAPGDFTGARMIEQLQDSLNLPGSLYLGGNESFKWDVVNGLQFVAADLEATNNNGPALMNETPSATNPTLVPDKSDATTGIGAGEGNLELISGGVSVITLTSASVTLKEIVSTTDGLNDDGVTFVDSGDNTKELEFEVSGITTATTRTHTVEDRDGIVALYDLSETKTGLTDASSNNIFSVAIVGPDTDTIVVDYSIEATDGTDYQIHGGTFFVNVYNATSGGTADGGTTHATSAVHSSSGSTGTLTDSWGVTTGTDSVTITLTPSSSLTTTGLKVTYTARSLTNNALTAQ